MNNSGAITGFIRDANAARHAFLRAPDGTFTIFDDPGAGTGSMSCGTIGNGQVPRAYLTNPNGIDQTGAITGFYFDANFVGHGFLRTPDGTITSFDAPGADMTPGSGNGTFGVSLISNGEIEGVYVDPNGVLHGFVRSTQGTFTTFDVPSAGTGPGQGTLPESNNTVGAIAGNYIDASNVNHGFLRDKQGSFRLFDVPSAGTGPGQGTIPLDNNNSGMITGEDIDGA